MNIGCFLSYFNNLSKLIIERRYVNLALIIFSIFILVESCKHEVVIPNDKVITPIPTKGKVKDTSNCHPDTVYFVNSILPIIQSNCAMSGCHGKGSAQDGVELSNYNNIISTGDITAGSPNNSDFFEAIIESDVKKMMPPPPNSKLNSKQIDLIRKWIEQGAKNNECKSGCDSSQFNYSANIAPIIQTNCIGCHNTNNVKIGNYAQLKSQVDNGKFWGVINHKQGFLPMPSSTFKLSDCDIKKIQKWIAAGAPNN